MSVSKNRNLELLRDVAMNLYSPEDHGTMNELHEGELAGLIHSYYKVNICI